MNNYSHKISAKWTTKKSAKTSFNIVRQSTINTSLEEILSQGQVITWHYPIILCFVKN